MKKRILALLLACGMVLSLGIVGGYAAEEETAAEEPAEEAAEAPAEEELTLSDDLYSFQVQIEGKVYAFPMPYQDFVDAGWKIDMDEDAEVEAHQYGSISAKQQYLEIDAYVINLGINLAPLSECMVGGVSFDKYQFEDVPEVEILFPGGLKFGEATREDLEAAYGAPYDEYEGSDYVELTYRYDSYQEWEFTIDNETGVVNEFDMENFVEDEDAIAAAAAQVSSEPIEAVLAYEAPEAMSDDPLDYVFELAGDLYKLPAPVSAFIENGWTLKKEGGDTGVVMGYDYDYATLMKDGEDMSVSINNYDPNAQVVENCFVTDITFYSSDDFGLKLPYEITFEMTGDELVAALDSIPKDILPQYDVDDDSDLATYYTIVDMDDEYQGIKIAVDKDDNTISWLEIEHEPDSLS